jgi:hypothetical protein
VRFVNHEQRELGARQLGDHCGLAELLGSQQQEFEVSGFGSLQRGLPFARAPR